jgi:hypothetical protein
MLKARRMTREEYTARRHALVLNVLYGNDLCGGSTRVWHDTCHCPAGREE